MAKIATDSERGLRRPQSRTVASGEGWRVAEVACSLGPQDQPFEEQHSCISIAIVTAGTFQYRSRNGRELMTPASLMLGSPGQYFACGHEHGKGDRCISFSYGVAFFEQLKAGTGAGCGGSGFKAIRLPPVRTLSPLIAEASAALASSAETPWEELSVRLAARTLEIDGGTSLELARGEAGALARVTRVVRMIDGRPDDAHSLRELAAHARLSPYHFLRTFQGLTGVTPHQYLLRVRLRRAAIRLSLETTKIVDVALESGFGDISNFNRTFRSEFGTSPRGYRRRTRRG